MNVNLAIGVWNGTLTVNPSTQIILIFHFIYVNSYLKGYLDVPIQSIAKLPFTDIQIDENYMSFNITPINAYFEGNLTNNKEIVNGFYEQNSVKLQLVLKKTSNLSEYHVNRPQTPTRPFNYIEEEIKIQNLKANVTLYGTLTYMSNTRPIALALLAHGSGGHDRDETIYEHKPFLVIADHLTKHNIAVLRYDERGIGKSSGDFMAASDNDFADDILAGINFAQTHKILSNVTNIGVIGHSKGGATALIAKKLSHLIKFIVFLGSIGMDGESILYLQTKLILKADNYSDFYIDRMINVNKGVYEILKRESSLDKIRIELNIYFDSLIESSTNNEDKEFYAETKLYSMNQILSLSSPWFRNFLVFDPRPILAETKLPILALWGSNDLQVPAKENCLEMKKALDKAKNLNYELNILNDLNHLFQKSTTGNPNEYEKIEETFSIEALNMMSKWIVNTSSLSLSIHASTFNYLLIISLILVPKLIII